MPGIVGLITRKPREWAEPQLLRMVQATCHEPFYESGVWVDESLGIYVGWTTKDSFAHAIPARNAQGDILFFFSGEEYSEPSIPSHTQQSDGGFSYLLNSYKEDPTFPAGLNGRFHGLVVDRTRGTALLFNDRYGMHRLYSHQSEDAFYFAAEAKSILEVRPELRTVDSRSLGEFVALGCVLENRTLFQGIQALPPASAWSFRDGTLKTEHVYFQPEEWENQDPLEAGSYYEELRGVFSRSLPRYFNGGQPIGMSLTGGLDTRMIMAWQHSSAGSLPCYSFSGLVRDSQDVLISRQVARACGQPHEVIQVGDEFLANFSQYAERAVYLSDGCVGVNRSADLYVNQLARQIAPVRMTGNYGGEVLRQVRAFKPAPPLPDLFRPELLGWVQQAEKTYASLLHGHPLSFALFRQAPWHHHGLLALEQTQLSLRSPYLDNDFVRTAFRAPRPPSNTDEICLRLIADGNPALLDIRTDRGLAGTRGGLPTAVSREFLEFTFKAEYAYDTGMPQWLARIDHLLSPFHLERLFLGRHKFCHFRVWYRDALSGYIKDMLLDSRTLSRPYLQRNTVETMVQRHIKGDRNYTSAIHQVLTLEILHRLFLDSK